MTATCAICGFDAPFGLCSRCALRAALVESRREAMRVWLNEGLTPRPKDYHFDDGYFWDMPRAKPWRDFEGAEGVQESIVANGEASPARADASGVVPEAVGAAEPYTGGGGSLL